jgi:hypothetical protein
MIYFLETVTRYQKFKKSFWEIKNESIFQRNTERKYMLTKSIITIFAHSVFVFEMKDFLWNEILNNITHL